jgi:hypothetical protein
MTYSVRPSLDDSDGGELNFQTAANLIGFTLETMVSHGDGAFGVSTGNIIVHNELVRTEPDMRSIKS